MTCTITTRGVATAACWVIGFGLAITRLVLGVDVDALANGFLMVAGVLSVRAALNKHAAAWFTAYETGREVSKIRRLH